MTLGAYISGAAHLLLILWVFLGGVIFRADPPEILEVTEVALLTVDDLNALRPAIPEPEAVQDIAALDAPETETTPTAPGEATPQDALEQPEFAAPSDPEASPERPEPLVPETEIADEAPDIPQAPTADPLVALLPPSLNPGAPLDAPRVAPTPAPEAPPEAESAPEFVAPKAPVPDEEAVEATTEEEAAAPESATTEIVTEAEETGSGVPAASIRPPLRPVRQAAQIEEASESEEPVAGTEAAAAPAPSGPPLNQGEKDALRVAVQRCWNVGSLSTDALRTTVVVTVSMQANGRPDNGSIRLLSSDGDQAATRQAYEAARRAIIRCGSGGFPLPVEKFAHWQEIEMTFNPERMRIK